MASALLRHLARRRCSSFRGRPWQLLAVRPPIVASFPRLEVRTSWAEPSRAANLLHGITGIVKDVLMWLQTLWPFLVSTVDIQRYRAQQCWEVSQTQRRDGVWQHANEPSRADDVAPRVIFTCRALCCPPGPSSHPCSANRLLTFDLLRNVQMMASFSDLVKPTTSRSCL